MFLKWLSIRTIILQYKYSIIIIHLFIRMFDEEFAISSATLLFGIYPSLFYNALK